MKELIKNLLRKWGCSHKWKTIAQIEEGNIFSDNVTEVRRTLECLDCGKIKQIKL